MPLTIMDELTGDNTVLKTKSTSHTIPFAEEEIEGTVQERLARVAELCPDQPAVVMGNRKLSYNELDKASNQIAHAIVAHLGTESEPVALIMEHGVDIIVAILAVMKAGKFYVVLDLNASSSGMNTVLSDLETRLVLTDQKNYDLSISLDIQEDGVMNVDKMETFDSDALTSVTCTPDSLATITYTSGTTGQPKGAERTHRQCIHTAYTNYLDYNISMLDRVPFIFFFSSGVSINMLLGLLFSGATVYPVDIKKVGAVQVIHQFLEDKCTILISSSSLFRQFLEHLENLTDGKDISDLHLVIAATEQIYPQDIVRFKKVFPKTCRLAHPYGLTETTGVTQLFIDHDSEIPSEIVPVGYPMRDQEVFIVDEDGKDVGKDHIGEVAVRSRYLAPGYWRRPELNRQKFVSDPEDSEKRIYYTRDTGRLRQDGCLELMGRQDHEINMRGYRMYPPAIAAAITRLDNVRDAVVMTTKRKNKDIFLIAYVVPSSGSEITVSAIRRELAETMPMWMIPSVFVLLERLPLNTAGKVDRRALPEPESTRPHLDTPFVPPSTKEETFLAQIWANVLEVEPVGIHDDFSELGGYSLMMTEIAEQILKSRPGQTEVSLEELFEKPTVAEQAEWMKAN